MGVGRAGTLGTPRQPPGNPLATPSIQRIETKQKAVQGIAGNRE